MMGEQATPAAESPHETSPGYRGTLLVQLGVKDLDRSIQFYTEVMGFKLERRDDSLRWARIDPGVGHVIIGLGEKEVTKGSGSASLNFGVEDIEASRTRLEVKGVRFLGPTITVPGVVMLADLEDPDGNRIRLAQDTKGR